MSTDNKKQENADTQQASRRKLVKGLIGMPAMVTLASGAANAATSSVCISNNAAALTDQLKLDDGTFFALTRDCMPITDNPLDTNPALVTSGQTTSNSEASLFANQTIYETSGGAPMRIESPDNNIGNNPQACVVFVDGNGKIVSFDNTSNGDPVTSSCYTSFATSPSI